MAHVWWAFWLGHWSLVTPKRPGRRLWAAVSAGKIPFPVKQRPSEQRLGSGAGGHGEGRPSTRYCREPFGREVAESSDSHAMGQAHLDGRLDEIGCQERKRDRHIDLSIGSRLTPRIA